ncbi:MAG: hypothetical protein JNJ44_08470 [Zoogloeaceae bacterium]|nr:hypothetical protein [Zoogloeaceae bacterium]
MSGMLRFIAHCRDESVVGMDVLNLHSPNTKVLLGKTPEEARRLAPILFGFSGRTHEEAVTAACLAAQGLPPPQGEAAIRVERAVAAEMAQGHLWRLLLDWPPLFGHAGPRHRFSHLHRRLSQLRSGPEAYLVGGELLDLVANELLSGFFRAMREPSTLSEFVAMARRGGTIGTTLADVVELGAFIPDASICAPLLPALSAAEWAEGLGGVPDGAFCAAPTWDGQACETGPLARHPASPLVGKVMAQGHRVAARLFARVVDLGDCASRLRHPLPVDLPPLVDAAPLGPSAGVARVAAANGVVIHTVRLEEGRIAEYSVIRPSAWNYHPDGPFMREAIGRPAPERAFTLLSLRALVLALDPAEAYEVEVEFGDGESGQEESSRGSAEDA